jgi:leader peptidase (prepilin peptidase) / N-methyltransferase
VAPWPAWRAARVAVKWPGFIQEPRLPILADLPPALIVGVAIALGLTFGSFLNVVIYRVPRHQSVVWPGSHCPGCGRPIAGYDNLPVISYVLLLGRSRCCKQRISPRYPLVEAIGGLYGWALTQTVVASLPDDLSVLHAFGIFAAAMALGLGLLAAAFIDLEFLYLPDPITFGAMALGLLTVPLRPEARFLDALIGGAVGFLVVYVPFDLLYRLVRGRVGMGLGDAKLVALAGLWFGYKGALFVLMAAAVQGTMILLAVLLTRGRVEEPEAVRLERVERLAELEQAEGEDKERLAAEIAADPVLAEPPSQKLGQARLAFGPFLVIAILEYQLFQSTIVAFLVSELGVS